MLLLTPGPTPIPPEVSRAMARPIIHHRTPEFQALQRECDAGLQKIFRTTGPVLTLAGSGTLGFEAAQLSLLRPGDTVITCASGRFGERWQEAYDRIAARLRLTNVKVSAPWGEPVAPEALADALRAHKHASIITIVHSESSTTTANDIRAMARIARDAAPDALILVDAVSSVGAMPLEMDAWGIDIVATASQKALMMAPGLSFVALSPRAIERLKSRTPADTAAPLYMDLADYLRAHEKGDVLFTPPVSLFFGLRVSVGMIVEKGVERAWAETTARARASREALAKMGFRLMSTAPADSVTGVFYPEGVGEDLRLGCEKRRGVQFAAAQDRWKGKGMRMSHMGYVSAEETLTALEAVAAELAALRPRSARDCEAAVESARSALTSRVSAA